MLTYKIEAIIYNGVETVCGNYIIPKGIGTDSWSQTYDEVQLYAKKYNNVLYPTDSPFNILSENTLYVSIKNDDGTWLLKKRKIIF